MSNYGDTLSSEEKLEQVWRFMNQLKANGLDRLTESGYVQFDGVGVRLDKFGIQVANGGTETEAVYLVENLLADPETAPAFGALQGNVNATSAKSAVRSRSFINNQTTTARMLCTALDTGNPLESGLASVQIEAASTQGISPYPYIAVINEASAAEIRFYNTTVGLPQLSSLSQTMFQGNGAVYYNTTDGAAYIKINGSWVALGGGGMSLIVKEADETVNNSAVLQNDNELLFAVAANEVFQFEGVLMISSGAAPDFKMTFTGPTGAVGSFSVFHGIATSYGVATLGNTLSHTTGGKEVLRFWGGIHNGANAGNLTLQWAQNTADASNTTVFAGSYIKYQKET